MMDSQENALQMGTNEVINEEVSAQPAEEPQAEATSQVVTEPEAEAEAPAEPEATAEEEAPAEAEEPRKVYMTKKEVLDRIKDIAHGDEAPQKEEIDYLKVVFYKLHIAEREANLKAYIEAGGDPEAYQITRDEDEEVFKAEMGIIKEKRAKIFKEQEAEKMENLARKLEIIEKIKAMITSPEGANKAYQEFKALQKKVDSYALVIGKLYTAITSIELIESYSGSRHTLQGGTLGYYGKSINVTMTHGLISETSVFGDKEDGEHTVSPLANYTKGADIKDPKGIVVRVNPVNADIKSANIVLINSRGESLDGFVKVGTPKKFDKLLTRADNIERLVVAQVDVFTSLKESIPESKQFVDRHSMHLNAHEEG